MKITMAIIFYIVIVLILGLLSVFLYLNDFSIGTVEILFPAVGAALFLAYKSVYIDAPQPNIQKFSIGLVHDIENGGVYSLYRPAVGDSNHENYDHRDFRGHSVIDLANSINEFKDFDLNKKLKDKNDDLYPNSDVVLEFLELSILHWLRRYDDLYVGYEGSFTNSIGGGGSGGGVQGVLEAVSINTKNRNNIFIEQAGMKPPLPKGSSIIYNERAGSFECENR